MQQKPAEPLYRLISRIRKPAAVKDILASCLRSVYTNDPFAGKEGLPPPPQELFDGVMTGEVVINDIRCVIYLPPSSEIRPLLLYMHGGAFVVGCSEDTDYITRRLCFDCNITVISVNYRLAPENMFPTAIIDCATVLKWATENAADLGIDASRIYLGGDSAGGNLAAALALQLQKRAQDVQGLILLAPWLDMYVEKYPSYSKFAYDNIVMDAAYLGFARAAYAKFDDWNNPMVSPLMANIQDFPPAIMIIGTEDPLADQVMALASRARAQGRNDIRPVVYPDMPHSFYAFPHLFSEERDCFARISEFIEHTRSAWSGD